MQNSLSFLLTALILFFCLPVGAANSTNFFNDIKVQWGGHFRVQGSATRTEDETIYQSVGTGDYYDGMVNFRLKNKIFFNGKGYLETHYEAVTSGGDTRKKRRNLQRLFPGLLSAGLFDDGVVNDKTRLIDLSATIDEKDDYVFFHRLDRFHMTFLPAWGAFSIGRQALTWGNGMLFNPMDLFNPFSPTDIDRDYKTGEDMAVLRFYLKDGQEIQLLYVPRRNTAGKAVEWNESSLAGKMHFFLDKTEVDVMAARHYEDIVTGFGTAGYFLDAAWRFDFIWTFLEHGTGRDAFHCIVANMDYSWNWFGMNIYGLIEFYSNGLGSGGYSSRSADPDVLERLKRGEIFTLGRNYLSGQIQVEIHPLSKIGLTVINNLNDPSGIIQPHFILDISQNVQCIAGGSVYYGKEETEYGGFRITTLNLLQKPSPYVFLSLSWFF